MQPLRFFLGACILGFATAAAASTSIPLPDFAFAEAGAAQHGGSVAGLGFGWRLPWAETTAWGRLSTRLDAHIAQWSLPAAGNSGWRGYQVVLVPLVRHTWPAATAPIFVEGGVGLSYLGDHAPATSTKWNFHDTVAIGAQFGALKQYELSLRFVHQSNAGLRKPNRGMNGVQLRLSADF